MKPLSVAFVVLLLAGEALAGDLAAPQLTPRALANNYANAPYTNWSGAYLGINGGYGSGDSQWTMGLISTSVFNPAGFMFGGTIGFNYPVSEVLFGVEGDLDWASLNGSAAGCAINGGGAVASCETKSSMLGTARARMGYALDRTLIYATGGAAFGNFQTGLNPPATFDSTTRVGWAAGAGVEFAFSGNWSAKIEYLFVDLGVGSCPTVANCGSAAGASVSLTENLVRGGLNYRFGW